MTSKIRVWRVGVCAGLKKPTWELLVAARAVYNVALKKLAPTGFPYFTSQTFISVIFLNESAYFYGVSLTIVFNHLCRSFTCSCMESSGHLNISTSSLSWSNLVWNLFAYDSYCLIQYVVTTSISIATYAVDLADLSRRLTCLLKPQHGCVGDCAQTRGLWQTIWKTGSP